MPLYEYDCESHGVFETMHSMHDASASERCPSCGEQALRVLSAPRLARMSASERKAHDRNEKSRHEPRVTRKKNAPQKEERPALRASHHARPWAIGH